MRRISGVDRMNATYFGSTALSLNNATFSEKISGMIHPKYRFEFGGQVELNHDKLVLENWYEIKLNEIQSISCEFDENFSRFTTNVDSRPGFFLKGEPLIITHANRKIYLMINWSFFTGFTDNKKWLKLIEEKRHKNL